MFLIKGGRVKLSKVIEDGSELTIDFRKTGDFVGENMSERISWLTNQIGSVSVTNVEDRLYRVLVNVAKEHGIRDQK